MSLKNIRIAKCAIEDKVYAGYFTKDKKNWAVKKDITNEFHRTVIDFFSGFQTVLKGSDGREFIVDVKENIEAKDEDLDSDDPKYMEAGVSMANYGG